MHVFAAGKAYSLDDIRERKFEGLSGFYRHCLEFAWQWLGGTEEFSFITSGSTGVPKPMVFSRQQLELSASMSTKALSLDSLESCLVCLPIEYVAGRMMLVRGLENQMDIYLVEPSADPFASLDQPVDFISLVPLQLEAILANAKSTCILNKCRVGIVGGAAVYPELENKLQNLKIHLVQTYGMTETLSHVALRHLNGAELEEYFTLMDGVEVRQDDRGCLAILTPTHPEEWIQTNDIVKIIDTRHFEWLGRADFLINSGGVKIFPEKLEQCIEAHQVNYLEGRQFFIAGITDEKYGQLPVLIVEGESLEEEEQASLLGYLKTRLPKYQAPAQVLFVERFERSASGKLKRKTMMEKLGLPGQA